MIYLGGLMLVAVSLPLSIFTTSLAQFILFGNWLAEGSFRKKWNRLRTSVPLLVFMGVYFLHIAGLIWTSDIAYGLKDLQIKIPLLLMPLVIGSSEPLTAKELKLVLLTFVAGVLIASLASLLAMAGALKVDLSDYRSYSLFISHIRFSLMVVLAWGISSHYLFIDPAPLSRTEKIVHIILLVWLPVFLIFLKALSGLVIFILLVFVLALIRIVRMKDPVTRFMLLVFLLLLPLMSLLYTGNVVKNYYTVDLVDSESLDSLTIEGNPYLNILSNGDTENGHYIWLYVCFPELRREWNRVSELDFDGKDKRGQVLRITLIRYMSSKGLRKDAAGFEQMNEDDFRSVEEGLTNVIYRKHYSVYPRIYELVWELDNYKRTGNPNAHSVVQRGIYLKAGWDIALQHPVIGVGTGDVPGVFLQYYEKNHSPLQEKWRRRAHNQYLTFVITFGFPGALLIFFALAYPVIRSREWKSFLPFVFLFIMALSMLNEDTLETSAGVTLFAFFYVILFFRSDGEKKPGTAMTRQEELI